jgi:hypothetical protein
MTNPKRITNLSVMVEYKPKSYKRTTNLSTMVEYAPLFHARTSNIGLGVEYTPEYKLRTSNIGLGVEYIPWWHIRTSTIGLQVEYCEFMRIFNSVDVWPNGDVYVTGRFNDVGGIEARNVAMWDGSVWHKLGQGLQGGSCYEREGLTIKVHPSGDVYVGGRFHIAGGGNAYHVARWDGSSWHHLGIHWGLNDDVYTMEIKPDGTEIYFGGDFTDEKGDPGTVITRVARYIVATEIFESMGEGFDDTVFKLKLSPSGVLYAAGAFKHSGTHDVNYVSMWDGTVWKPLGANNMNDWATAIEFDSKGTMIVGGRFNLVGDLSVRSLALWNGSNWLRPDILLPPSYKHTISVGTPPCPDNTEYQYPHVNALLVGEEDDILAGGVNLSVTPSGHQGPIASDHSGITYIINQGSAETNPTIYIKGSGRLRYIENETTRVKIYFDLVIMADEEIFIDFEKGTILSTIRSDLSDYILSGSDFTQLTLIPGENKLAVFISDGVGSLVHVYYTPTHWSADITQHRDGY